MTTESVVEFRARAREWVAGNMPPIDPANPPGCGRDTDAAWQRARELQRRLYDGGFAGICFPREYGGLGLGYEYKKAFDAASAGYEMPVLLNIPSLSICCPTLLDTGSEQLKRTHVAAVLRGDEVMVQLLSEPIGGSDLAGVITRAERRGDTWVLNGAKTWSTFAFAADYGLCLVRTDWDVPKHEGLTMFLVPLRCPGVTVQRIRHVDGNVDFCEEFFDDVELTDEAMVGEPGKGWEVASRQLYHERRAMGDGSEFTVGEGLEASQDLLVDLVGLLEKTGQADCERAREMVGRSIVHRVVNQQLTAHVYHSVADGSLPPAAGAIARVSVADCHNLDTDTALTIAGTSAAVGDDAEALDIGIRYVGRQTMNIGGGTTEMARNVIAERVLNFPREYAADRGVPFREVRRSREKRTEKY